MLTSRARNRVKKRRGALADIRIERTISGTYLLLLLFILLLFLYYLLFRYYFFKIKLECSH